MECKHPADGSVRLLRLGKWGQTPADHASWHLAPETGKRYQIRLPGSGLQACTPKLPCDLSPIPCRHLPSTLDQPQTSCGLAHVSSLPHDLSSVDCLVASLRFMSGRTDPGETCHMSDSPEATAAGSGKAICAERLPRGVPLSRTSRSRFVACMLAMASHTGRTAAQGL